LTKGKILEGILFLVPRGTEGRASHPIMGSWASHPGSVTTVKAEEPWVKHRVSPFIDTRTSISAIPLSPGPRSSKKITVWGITLQPICYLSKELDQVVKGWPGCLRTVAAVSLLVPKAQKLILNCPLMVYIPCNIGRILNSKGEFW
jgi:hypothetical protein